MRSVCAYREQGQDVFRARHLERSGGCSLTLAVLKMMGQLSGHLFVVLRNQFVDQFEIGFQEAVG